MNLKNQAQSWKNENIWSTCYPMQVVVFSQTCINYQPLKFSHFEGSMIPSEKIDHLMITDKEKNIFSIFHV